MGENRPENGERHPVLRAERAIFFFYNYFKTFIFVSVPTSLDEEQMSKKKKIKKNMYIKKKYKYLWVGRT